MFGLESLHPYPKIVHGFMYSLNLFIAIFSAHNTDFMMLFHADGSLILLWTSPSHQNALHGQMLLLSSHRMKKCSPAQKSRRTSTLQRSKQPDPDAVKVRESMRPKWLVCKSLHILNKTEMVICTSEEFIALCIQNCWPFATRIWTLIKWRSWYLTEDA